MTTDKTLIKFGFVKDENNSQLKEVFKNNLKLKEMRIDIYPDNPMSLPTTFMLLLRTHEKNVIVSSDSARLVLKRNDRYNTHFMNVSFSNISECFFKLVENYYEFILNIRNTYYKITIIN
jgi:hypothetical protein